MRTLVLMCWLGMVLGAADVRVTFDASESPTAQTVIGALVMQSADTGELHPDLLALGLGEHPLAMSLSRASSAGARQALAHALSDRSAPVWWARTAAGRMQFQRSLSVPQGPMSVVVRPSILTGDHSAEAMVQALLAPWLGGDAGIGFDPDDGTWSATLDSRGQTALVEVITALEQTTARIPSLVPDPDTVDLTLTCTGFTASNWSAIIAACRDRRISVSVSPRLAAQSPSAAWVIPTCTYRDLPARWADVGIAAQWMHGVLCLATSAEELEDRELPAQRRVLAVLPVGHLIDDAASGRVLSSVLISRVAPRWWTYPGSGLWFRERSRSLVVSADIPTIHLIMDALAIIEHRGLSALITGSTRQ